MDDVLPPADVPAPDYIENADSLPDDGTFTVIAGSRSATDEFSDAALQDRITSTVTAAGINPAVVISGTANGVDEAGEAWAAERDIPTACFPAPWNDTDRDGALVRDGKYGTYDALAGPRRNRWMANYAVQNGDRGILIAILVYDENGDPSSGTSDMIDLCRTVLGDENIFVSPAGNYDGNISSDLEPVTVRP